MLKLKNLDNNNKQSSLSKDILFSLNLFLSDFVVLRASKGRHIFEDTTLHFALLFLIDFIVFRATKGSGLAPEKEPR